MRIAGATKPGNASAVFHRQLDQDRLQQFAARLYEDRKFRDWGIQPDELRRCGRHGVPGVHGENLARRDDLGRQESRLPAPHSDDPFRVPRGADHPHPARRAGGVSLDEERLGHRRKRPLGKITRATQKWRSAIREIGKHEDPARFLTLRYEDLVTATEATLTRVCEFLGVPFDPCMLNFHEINAAKGLVPQTRVAKHTSTLRPVTSHRAEAWRKELSPVEIEALEFRNRSLMLAHGYQPVSDGLGLKSAARLTTDFLETLVLPIRALVTRREEDDEGEDERSAP
jgi:hypothetical protein